MSEKGSEADIEPALSDFREVPQADITRALAELPHCGRATRTTGPPCAAGALQL